MTAGFRIKDIHAILSNDENGEEGVLSVYHGDAWTPLISADPGRLEDIELIAQKIADRTGKNFKIVRFSVREDIGEIKAKRRP